MRKVQLVIAGLGALLSSGAFAATEKFHLDYTMTNPAYMWPPHPVTVTLSADFTGERNGDVITDLVFQKFSLNNMSMASTGAVQLFPYGDGVPRISFSGKNNSFMLGGSGPELYGNFYSYAGDWNLVGMELTWKVTPPGVNPGEDIGPYVNMVPEDYAINSSWRVTAVPEPETYGMLLAGMGVIGLMARRRKA
jgi:hypothetical protein